jgi:hypothetical protein
MLHTTTIRRTRAGALTDTNNRWYIRQIVRPGITQAEREAVDRLYARKSQAIRLVRGA